MAQRFTTPNWQGFDGNGDPLAGGELYFYISGTNTPLDTYSDSGLTVANANPVEADASGRFGDIFLSAADYKVILKDADGVTVWTADPVTGSSGTLPQAFIAGLTISNNGTDANNDIDIATGRARDSTNVDDLVLATALTKRLDATWAVGDDAGGLDTGSKANSTGYYVWLIKRADTGVVDVLFSTSGTAPTMPADYDYKRLIGYIKTNGSGNILAFTQVGDFFKFTATILDVSDSTIVSDTFETAALSVPGRSLAFILGQTTNTNAQTNFRLYVGPGGGGEASGDDLVRLATANAEPTALGGSQVTLTDSSGQIRYAALEGGNTQSVFIITSGFLMLTRSNP